MFQAEGEVLLMKYVNREVLSTRIGTWFRVRGSITHEMQGFVWTVTKNQVNAHVILTSGAERILKERLR